MTLTLDRLSVWLPGRGTVLSSVSAELAGVVLLVGRSGSGASTLLRTLGGRLPAGARYAGTVRLAGTLLTGHGSDDLSGTVDGRHLADLADPEADDVLRRADPGLRADLGADPGGRPLTPSQRRATARLVRVLGGAAPVVLLDQPLAGLAPHQRPAAGDAIRRLASAGTVVVWAEHLVEDALGAADQVAELVAPTSLAVTPSGAWRPRTIPAPPALALARALGHPADDLDELPRHHVSASERHDPGEVLAVADPVLSRLDRPVDLHAHECVGIVGIAGEAGVEDADRATEVARRLTAIAGGATTLPPLVVLPPAAAVGAVVRAWELRNRLQPGRVREQLAPLATLDPVRAVADHSTGEQAALRWALATAVPGARVLVDPTQGLDPAGRRYVARRLHADRSAPVFLVSSDAEVLTRACHRILVVSGGHVVADGAPLTVLDLLPARPQLARRGARAVRVRSLVPPPVLREVVR
ncbi:hypothetical protein [Pimelobacter simplex]|uniref:hypothetical protein n=1 Tax=Nocardioides simplex TaxID=2045 RepID=UPI003AAAAB53